MIKLKRRIGSAVLAVMMLLSLMPLTALAADDPEVITITNATELANAIASQKDNQIWKISNGKYVLTQELLDKYSSWTESETGGQPNWYFPIYKDGIHIIGEGDVTITSDVETTNGVWASQDFISVWGDNITIENVDILSKKEQNKAIEVMGKNFTLKDCELKKVDKNGSGSIIFNAEDIGTATLENVKLYSWVSANYSKKGTLNTTNVTIDFTDNTYAGYHNDTYGYGWCPGIFNSKDGCNVIVENTGLTLIVDNDISLSGQVFNGNIQPNTTVQLMPGEYDVTVNSEKGTIGSGCIIDEENITLEAFDPTNKPVLYGFSTEFNAGVDQYRKNGQDTIYVSGKNVTLENLVIMPLGGIGENANTWQKTVEVVAGAEGFTMTGCETRPNNKTYNDQTNSMENAAGNIHVSIDDAAISGNSFGEGTTISAGWIGNTAAEGTYSVNVSGNYWGEGVTAADIAGMIDGNVIVDTYYTDAEMTTPETIGGTPVATAEQLKNAIANAKDGAFINTPPSFIMLVFN